MGRPYLETIQLDDVEVEEIEEGPLAGAGRRILSQDDVDGSYTAVVSLSAGFDADPAPGRAYELYVLEGDVSVGGTTARPGWYAYAPGVAPERRLAADGGAVVLLMVEEERADAGAVDVVDPDTLEWKPSSSPGEANKLFRVDEERGDVSGITTMAPGTGVPFVEVHEPIDEGFILRGDILFGRPAEAGPGSYFWRPPRVRHLPKLTRGGAVYFFRAKGGGGLGAHVDLTEDAAWPERVAAYYADEPTLVRT